MALLGALPMYLCRAYVEPDDTVGNWVWFVLHPAPMITWNRATSDHCQCCYYSTTVCAVFSRNLSRECHQGRKQELVSPQNWAGQHCSSHKDFTAMASQTLPSRLGRRLAGGKLDHNLDVDRIHPDRFLATPMKSCYTEAFMCLLGLSGLHIARESMGGGQSPGFVNTGGHSHQAYIDFTPPPPPQSIPPPPSLGGGTRQRWHKSCTTHKGVVWRLGALLRCTVAAIDLLSMAQWKGSN